MGATIAFNLENYFEAQLTGDIEM
jgi:hypothetical protein